MTEDTVSEIQRLVVGFQNGTVTLNNQILASDELNLMSQTLVSIKGYLEKISRTSKLWLLYIAYVDVIKLFISAERLWLLYMAYVDVIKLFISASKVMATLHCLR